MVLLFVIAGINAAGPLLSAQAESPRAVVAEPVHDFGTVKQGDHLVHQFVIRNDGNAPLTISRVDLTTPGTKARFKETIGPSESGRISIEWDTSSAQGEFDAGAIVRLNDPKQPRVSLRLTATVKAPIEYSPGPDAFFSAYRDETPERIIKIVNNQEHPLKIVRAEGSDHYDISIVPVREGFAYDVRIKVRANVPFGRYPGESIYLHTDNAERPRLELRVNLLVKPDFYAAPEDVNLGTVSLEKMTKQPQLLALLDESLTISNRRGPVEIARIESDIAALQIAQTPNTGSSQRFRLTVSLAPDRLKAGSLTGNIRVITTDPAMPALVIPVRGEVK